MTLSAGPLDLVTHRMSSEHFDALNSSSLPRFRWNSPGYSLIGFGDDAVRIDPGTGESRFARAAIELERLFEDAGSSHDDAGPVAFATFTFDERQTGSAVVIPEALATRRDGRHWITLPLGDEPDRWLAKLGPSAGVAGDTEVRHRELDPGDFIHSVELALAAIARGELEKVVLAMPFEVTTNQTIGIERVMRRLMDSHPESYVFAFEGFIGASPELLVRRAGPMVASVPLAGSARRGASAREDEDIGRELLASDKQRREHDLAVRTVARALSVVCADLKVDTEPALVRLRDVMHLGTSVTGKLIDPLTALDLAGALHPTAAVCGWPREAALETIRRVESQPRGRYAGPVGWMDARGDGEFAIALRCAEVRGDSARLWAGAGIVEGSVPEEELEEVRLKALTMLTALGT